MIFPASAVERFWAKVDRTDADGCWSWVAAIKACGYPYIWVAEAGHPKFGREWRAHRFAYELLVGSIPDGMTIDHVCENKLCVNPAHLEAVSNSENVRRATRGPCATNKVKTHCVNGHPFDEANTYIRKDTNTRQCRACCREREARKRSRL